MTIQSIGSSNMIGMPRTAPRFSGNERQNLQDSTLFTEAREAANAYRANIASSSQPQAASENPTGLMQELHNYIKDPTFYTMCDAIQNAMDSMGLPENQKHAIFDKIVSLLRSGVPAEGEQTADFISNLQSILKDTKLMTDPSALQDLANTLLPILDTYNTESAREDSQNKNGSPSPARR